MASNSPRILTVRFIQNETESKVIFEFGVREIGKLIPQGHGVLRASAILDEKGFLSDAELVTEKV